MSYVSVAEASRNLSHWINQASYGRDCVVITSRGKAKAVLIGIDAFEAMIGVEDQGEPMSLEELQQGFGQALAAAGYQTREDIIRLVQEVKEELAAERIAEKSG